MQINTPSTDPTFFASSHATWSTTATQLVITWKHNNAPNAGETYTFTWIVIGT